MSDWDVLTGQVERDRRNVSLLMQSVGEVYGTFSMDDRMRRAVDRAVSVSGAERGILFLEDGERGLVPVVARDASGRNLPLDLKHCSTVVDRVLTSGEAYRELNLADMPVTSASIVDAKLLSVMAAPLMVEGERLGVLYVDSQKRIREFEDADFRVYRALAGLIGSAIQSGRLLADRQAKERMERQLELAH
ncbi:MAG: GAF domain-containing protein, partial [Planctomycetota bacterium]